MTAKDRSPEKSVTTPDPPPADNSLPKSEKSIETRKYVPALYVKFNFSMSTFDYLNYFVT